MSFAIALVALQAAAQPGGMKSNSTPPPPVIVSVAPEPAIVAVPGPPGRFAVYAIPEANEAPPDELEMRVTSGSETLWEGRLRVGKSGASVLQYVHQTEPPGCPAGGHSGMVHSTNHISLQRWKLNTTPAGAFQYQLKVSWERPGSARGCRAEGARTVEIKQGIDLKPGQSVTLKGDVGLAVRVRRR